jgi:hypothetical protein
VAGPRHAPERRSGAAAGRAGKGRITPAGAGCQVLTILLVEPVKVYVFPVSVFFTATV